MIVSHNAGMSVAQVTELRQGLRAQGARYKVTKNTLTKIAIKGTKHEEINDMLTGPKPDCQPQLKKPLVVAKTIYDFAKNLMVNW